MENKNKIISNKSNHFYNSFDSFVHAKKQISICNLSSYQKIVVYGPNANNLINKYSVRDITKIKDNSFFTVFLKKKRFLSEVQIIKLTAIKYVIIGDNLKKTLKILNKSKRKFPLVTIQDGTHQYSFFSFHGDKVHSYFETNKSPNLFKVTQQKYTYYTLLTSNINKFAVLDHFKSLGFFEISLATLTMFLYNNSVITNLSKIKKSFKLNTYLSLYNSDNYKLKKNFKSICIKQYELTKNIVCTSGMKLYNDKHKNVGYVHNYYRLPYKKNPFILCIVKKYKIDKIAILKKDKEEILIKEYMQF